MIKAPLTIIAGIAFLSLTASAQMRRPDLSKYFNPAALPGFSIPPDVTAPRVTEPRFIRVADEESETAKVLAILSREVLNRKPAPGEPVKALSRDTLTALMGADAVPRDNNKDDVIPKGYASDKTDPAKPRSFSITDIRHKSDIIIEVLDKPARKIRTYLVSPDGTLESAVETIKVNGKFLDEKVPNEKVSKEQVEAYFKAELEFWKTYYKTVKLAQKT